MTKKHILFVDDEPNILQGLKRMLRSLRNEWDIDTAESGEQALGLLSQAPYDVIVSDMRMPGMDGAQLLNEVMQRYPQIVRLVLSGQSDQEGVFRSIGPTHQYLSKPCDAEILRATIDRACSLRDVLQSGHLRRLVSQIKTLPSLPSLYSEIARELQSPDTSQDKLGRIISRDPGMTAKLLQLVNSAFFGFYTQVTDPARAITILGLDRLRSLVLSIHIFSSLNHEDADYVALNAYWQHNLLVGQCAKNLALSLSDDKVFLEETYMAGLLHDTGKIILISNLSEDYQEVINKSRMENLPMESCEKKYFGASHAEIGAYLLGLWGLPTPIVEAVAFHHHPSLCQNQALSPLVAVHAADALLRELQPVEPWALGTIDLEYLQRLGVQDRLAGWRSACEEHLRAVNSHGD